MLKVVFVVSICLPLCYCLGAFAVIAHMESHVEPPQYAPTVDVLKSELVLLSGISIANENTGWRETDADRVDQLTRAFLDGEFGRNVLGRVRLLEDTDVDDKRLIDDGLQTVTALSRLGDKWKTDPNVNDLGQAWDAALVTVFTSGLLVDVVRYENKDRDHRVLVNAQRHEAETNRFRYTPVYLIVQLAKRHLHIHSQNKSAATRALTPVFGSNKTSTIYRWLSAAVLSDSQQGVLKAMPYCRMSFVLQNPFLTGQGAAAQQRLSETYGLYALEHLKEQYDELEDRSEAPMTSKQFQTRVCKPLKIIELWAKSTVKTFGVVASNSSAFLRLLDFLRSPSGLRQVEACMAAGVNLAGASASNPGIQHCYDLIAQFKDIRAGGQHGVAPATATDSQEADATDSQALASASQEETAASEAAELVDDDLLVMNSLLGQRRQAHDLLLCCVFTIVY